MMETADEFRRRYLEQIKTARLELNLTQAQFAELAGVSRRTVQDWESQKNFPQPRHRRKLDKIIKAAENKAQQLADALLTMIG